MNTGLKTLVTNLALKDRATRSVERLSCFLCAHRLLATSVINHNRFNRLLSRGASIDTTGISLSKTLPLGHPWSHSSVLDTRQHSVRIYQAISGLVFLLHYPN